MRLDSFLTGNIKSCGCYSREVFWRKGLFAKGVSKKKEVIAKGVSSRRKTDLKENTSLSSLTQKLRSDNKSGHKGVFYDKRRGMWVACLTFQGEIKLREYYESKTDAINARKEAEEKYFEPILNKYKKENE